MSTASVRPVEIKPARHAPEAAMTVPSPRLLCAGRLARSRHH